MMRFQLFAIAIVLGVLGLPVTSEQCKPDAFASSVTAGTAQVTGPIRAFSASTRYLEDGDESFQIVWVEGEGVLTVLPVTYESEENERAADSIYVLFTADANSELNVVRLNYTSTVLTKETEVEFTAKEINFATVVAQSFVYTAVVGDAAYSQSTGEGLVQIVRESAKDAIKIRYNGLGFVEVSSSTTPKPSASAAVTTPAPGVVAPAAVTTAAATRTATAAPMPGTTAAVVATALPRVTSVAPAATFVSGVATRSTAEDELPKVAEAAGEEDGTGDFEAVLSPDRILGSGILDGI